MGVSMLVCSSFSFAQLVGVRFCGFHLLLFGGRADLEVGFPCSWFYIDVRFNLNGFVDVVSFFVYEALYVPRQCVLIFEIGLGFDIRFFVPDVGRPCHLF